MICVPTVEYLPAACTSIYTSIYTQPPLINTLLQRGVNGITALFNRFSGFRDAAQSLDGKTAKAVESPGCPTITPLKRGVNETCLLGEEICPAPRTIRPTVPHCQSTRTVYANTIIL